MSLGRQRLGLALLLALATAAPALADDFRPAYLQLRQVDAETYDVLWKVPALDEATTLKVRPALPAQSEVVVPMRTSFAAGAAVQTWRVKVDGGLAGKAIEFPDLGVSRVDVLVRVERADGTTQTGRVLRHEPRFVVTASPGAFEVARSYTRLGIEHILLGVDHLLFVLALLILVKGAARLIATITAFTLAHSLTLFAATLGWVNIPGSPVEAVIALSIVFVAGEIVRARQGRPGLTQRYPWIVAFTFGLLHGLGFAGALAEVGLPPLSIPLALLFFNVGVEIGQLMFIAAVLAVIAAGGWMGRTWRLPVPRWLWRVPPYAIGGVAGFWVVERIAAFTG
ncbi:MAG: HupE/UreJ family protein [Burkholderiales bacterium]|nr:HupE/UreJ family protein [Burkholderiales bacterium]